MRVLQLFAPMQKFLPEVEEPSSGQKRVMFRCGQCRQMSPMARKTPHWPHRPPINGPIRPAALHLCPGLRVAALCGRDSVSDGELGQPASITRRTPTACQPQRLGLYCCPWQEPSRCVLTRQQPLDATSNLAVVLHAAVGGRPADARPPAPP